MKKNLWNMLLVLIGIIIGVMGVKKIYRKKIVALQQLSDKHLSLFLMMNQWVAVKQKEKNLAAYLEQNGYREIAIYGVSYAGETLLEELRGSGVMIKYAIDKHVQKKWLDIDVYSPEAELEPVDAIVVTPIFFFDEIYEMLSQKVTCEIISLEYMLYDI